MPASRQAGSTPFSTSRLHSEYSVTDGIVRIDDAVARAAAESGVATNYLRVRAFPFNQQVQDFLDAHERIYVVEQNRDAQLRALLTMETDVEKKKLRSILHYDGLPMSADFVVQGIGKALAKEVAA